MRQARPAILVLDGGVRKVGSSDQHIDSRTTCRSADSEASATYLVLDGISNTFHVSVDHLLDERVKVDLPSPAKGLLSLGGRSKQQINFTRSEVLSQRKTAKPGAGR